MWILEDETIAQGVIIQLIKNGKQGKLVARIGSLVREYPCDSFEEATTKFEAIKEAERRGMEK